MRENDGKPTSGVEDSAKKSYTKPMLTIYGTIRDLTKTVGPNGPADGGAPASGKFATQI
jgi:hypothetical protein